MKTVVCDVDTILSQYLPYRENAEEIAFILKLDKTVIIRGKEENSCNLEAIEDSGIVNYYMPYQGGCGIMSPGSLGVIAFTKTSQPIISNLRLIVRQVLTQKGIKTKLQNNDVMVYDSETDSWYKFIGTAATFNEHNKFEAGMFISLTLDIDKIKMFCTKEMKNVPKSLGDFGITMEDLLKPIETYLQNYIPTI